MARAVAQQQQQQQRPPTGRRRGKALLHDVALKPAEKDDALLDQIAQELRPVEVSRLRGGGWRHAGKGGNQAAVLSIGPCCHHLV